jgi:16S rRNA (guanine527-N7)-methyltransferase
MEKEVLSERLREGIERAAGRMGYVVCEENLQSLVDYALELERWNRAYNLVGRNIGLEGYVSLFVDAISPLCVKGLLDAGKEVVDIGSGAGFPGLPIYILAGPLPLTLVESQRKKVTFLRHIKRQLELEEVKIFPGRLEEMARTEDHLNAYEVGISRAVADPLRLAKAARTLICEGGRLVLFVGKADGERVRKAASGPLEGGFRVESVKSTQRIVGKENYLAILRKISS